MTGLENKQNLPDRTARTALELQEECQPVTHKIDVPGCRSHVCRTTHKQRFKVVGQKRKRSKVVVKQRKRFQGFATQQCGDTGVHVNRFKGANDLLTPLKHVGSPAKLFTSYCRWLSF
jgi:hypothetical protein